LLDQVPRPTALLAMSDQLALGALDAARARGLDVPGDLSVVGFDDIPAAARAAPGLTTVRQPLVEKGQQAGALLVAAVQGREQDQPVTVTLPTELIVRGSTARAPLP
jgi:DNA-binding LacI/PurR family transcriptional regulator